MRPHLNCYGYHEECNYRPISWKVEIADESNAIAIIDDGKILAELDLQLNSGILQLFANKKAIANVPMPMPVSAINSVKYDEENQELIFSVTLSDETTKEIKMNVKDMVSLYRAGQGIRIDDKRHIHVNKGDGLKFDCDNDEAHLCVDLDQIASRYDLRQERQWRKMADQELRDLIGSLATDASGSSISIAQQLNSLETALKCEIERSITVDTTHTSAIDQINHSVELGFNNLIESDKVIKSYLDKEISDRQIADNEIYKELIAIKDKNAEQDETLNSLDEKIDSEISKTEDVENKINETITSLEEKTDKSIKEICNSVGLTTTSDGIEYISPLMHTLATSDSNTLINDIKQLDDSIRSVDDKFDGIIGISDGSMTVFESIESVKNDISDVDKKTDDLSTEIKDLDNKIDNVNSDLQQSISKTKEELTKEIENSSSELKDKIDSITDSIDVANKELEDYHNNLITKIGLVNTDNLFDYNPTFNGRTLVDNNKSISENLLSLNDNILNLSGSTASELNTSINDLKGNVSEDYDTLRKIEDNITALSDSIELKSIDDNFRSFSLLVKNKIRNTITIPRDTTVTKLSFNEENNHISVHTISDSGESNYSINLSSLDQKYTNGNGLDLVDDKFSVKLKQDGYEKYVTIDEDGISVKPIIKKLGEVKNEGVTNIFLTGNTEQQVLTVEGEHPNYYLKVGDIASNNDLNEAIDNFKKAFDNYTEDFEKEHEEAVKVFVTKTENQKISDSLDERIKTLSSLTQTLQNTLRQHRDKCN